MEVTFRLEFHFGLKKGGVRVWRCGWGGRNVASLTVFFNRISIKNKKNG